MHHHPFVQRSLQSLFYMAMYHVCYFTCAVCFVTQCKVRSSIILPSPRHAESECVCDAAVGVCNNFAEGHMGHHLLTHAHSSLCCLCHQDISSGISLIQFLTSGILHNKNGRSIIVSCQAL